MTYGHVYVAHVAFGANDTQTVRAFLEAESYPGPSLIIGYAHCIAHGIEIKNGLSQQAEGGRQRPLAAVPLRSAAGRTSRPSR